MEFYVQMSRLPQSVGKFLAQITFMSDYVDPCE